MEITMAKQSNKHPDYNYVEKWSEKLLPSGYTQVPNDLFKFQAELKITNGELTALLHCLLFKWSTSNPYPSVETIAKRSGMSAITVRRHFRNLENKSLIKRIRRYGETSEYDFTQLRAKLEDISSTHSIDVQKQIAELSKLKDINYPNLNTKEDPNSNKDALIIRNSKMNRASFSNEGAL